MQNILTWHPLGKPGSFISRKRYDAVRNFILMSLASGEMTMVDLIASGEQSLGAHIDKNVAWHILVVKLDLEARGLIISTTKLTPYKSQFIKLTKMAVKQFMSRSA